MSAIGFQRRCAVAMIEQFGLAPFRGILPSCVFASIARETGCAPKRRHPLVPEVIAWLMMYVGLQTTSMTQGLCQAWGLIRAICPWLTMGCVTEEAFCQARSRLTLGFFHALWNHLRGRFAGRFGAALLWKNTYRLLAVDGSDVSLPRSPINDRYFGKPRNTHGDGRRPQAKLVALCSVFTGYCFAFKLVGKRWTEHQGLFHLIRELQADDLVLADRGFFSYRAIWQIPLCRAHFLMRLSDQQAGYTQRRTPLNPHEWQAEFRPTEAVRRRCPDLPETLTARLVRYQWPGFRPSWLLTSLPSDPTLPAEELVSLYHRRWQIETIYREWKHGLDIQNLRSLTPTGLMKECHAQLLLSNLVRWVMTEATEPTTLHPVDLSYLTALTCVKNAALQMLRANPDQLAVIYQQLLHEIRNAKIRKRPGRAYPRKLDRPKYKGKGHTREPARLNQNYT